MAEYVMEPPVPWDLPEPPPAKPKKERKRRGVDGVSSGPARAATWRPVTAPRETFRLDDCPGCGYLVLVTPWFGETRLVDIWEVPYADACVLDRYSHENGNILWFENKRRLFAWNPMMKCSALRTHRCGNNWWNRGPYIGFRNDYVKDEVYL